MIYICALRKLLTDSFGFYQIPEISEFSAVFRITDIFEIAKELKIQDF